MKPITLILFLLCLWSYSYSQVVINEVMVKPPTSSTSSTFQSLKDCANPTYGKEYIELYNTSCTPVDISCYFLGCRTWNNTSDGTFRFPLGTIIAGHSWVSIGGPGTGATFELNNYCADPHLVTNINRWYLDNGDAYIALYDGNGNAVNVVFWTTGAGQASKWNSDSDLDEPPSNVPNPAGCPVVASLPGPATIPGGVVEYAGEGPALGNVIHRTVDGGPTWDRAGTPSINNCNGVCDPCVILPVTIVLFDVICDNNFVKVSWATSSEINNDFFTIERSTDAVNFEPIGIVSGNGNSSSIINYTFIDDNPLEQTTYYRLKQTDFNSDYEYHGIRAVTCSNEDYLSVYPNPFEDNLTIELNGEFDSSLNLEVTNYLGQVIYRQTLKNNINKINLDKKLASGNYFIKVFNENTNITQRVVKIN